MEPDAAVRTVLLDTPDLVAVVGQRIACSGRMPEVAEEGVNPFPAITILAGKVPETTLSGRAGLDKATLEVHVHAIDTDDEGGLALAKRISSLVVAALHCTKGQFGTLQVEGCFFVGQDDLEPDDDTGLEEIVSYFELYHR